MFCRWILLFPFFFFFFFNDTATTEIYTLSLHDALPIWTVNAAAKNQLAFYNAAGNAVSGTSAFATPVPAACNGSTDDTSVINTTLASMSQGVAQLPPGNCKISGTINIPNFVTLRGQGSGLAWSTIGVGSSDDTYPTRLVWTGGATASVVSFAALAQDSGLADLTVDGGITSGYGSSSIVGVSLTSCHGVRLSNVSIQYVGVGVQLAPPGGAGSNCSWNRFYDTRILHVRSGIIFNPTGSASPSGATDNFFYNTWIYDYALYGVGFSNLSDDNHFFGSYVSTLVQNSIGIVLNYSTPTTQNGVYSNDFYDVVMDIFNNNGSTYSIIVNATGDTGSTVGQSDRFSGYISTAGTNINPPIVQNSGRAIFNINDGRPPSVTTCGSGASVVGNEYDGRIQVGSGSVTSCQLNWNTQASSTGFARAPSCVVSASSGAFGISVSPSTTSLALTFTTSAGSAVLSYHCTPL